MPRRARERRRGCLGKRTFRSMETALAEAARVNSEILFSTEVMSAYKCKFSRGRGHFHIGHSEGGDESWAVRTARRRRLNGA